MSDFSGRGAARKNVGGNNQTVTRYIIAFSGLRILTRIQGEFDKMRFSSEFALAKDIKFLRYKVQEEYAATRLQVIEFIKIVCFSNIPVLGKSRSMW